MQRLAFDIERRQEECSRFAGSVYLPICTRGALRHGRVHPVVELHGTLSDSYFGITSPLPTDNGYCPDSYPFSCTKFGDPSPVRP
jgi:hypothetical protein